MLPIIYALASALLFAITFFFRKQAVRTMPIQLAFLVESIIYIFIPLIMFLILPQAVRKSALQNTNGILYAILAGIFVVGGVALNYLALKDGFLSKVISVTSPAQIIVGVTLGMVLLRENLTQGQLVGVILGIISIVLISK